MFDARLLHLSRITDRSRFLPLALGITSYGIGPNCTVSRRQGGLEPARIESTGNYQSDSKEYKVTFDCPASVVPKWAGKAGRSVVAIRVAHLDAKKDPAPARPSPVGTTLRLRSYVWRGHVYPPKSSAMAERGAERVHFQECPREIKRASVQMKVRPAASQQGAQFIRMTRASSS
jgi:hypothetical protein